MDIPRLFAYLATILPKFQEWIASTGATESKLHRLYPLSEAFDGDDPKIFYRHPEPSEFGNVYLYTVAKAEEEAVRRGRMSKEISVEGSLMPYFRWLRENSDTGGYFCFDQVNQQFANTFVYGLWRNTSQDLSSQAHLFKDYPVLKLGGIKLPRTVSFDARHLDFCDLDFLEIGEGWSGSRWKPINFSSCRELLFKDATANFFDFYRCTVWDLVIQDSKIQDMRFRQCSGTTMRFENCTLSKVSFLGSHVMPIFSNCQPSQIDYTPDPQERRYAADANAYRAIRSLFQSVGLTSDAGRYFYLEQKARRKMLYSPYAQHREQYRDIDYPGELQHQTGPTRGRPSTAEQAALLRKRRRLFHLKAWLHPKYALTTIRFKLKWAASMVDYLLWGYGERPTRIFGAAGVVIAFYAFVFNILGPQIKTLAGPVDCIYLSMVTFSTLGYGDILPTTSLAKLVCASEAIVGAFTMGLVVAGFSNRSRY